MALIDDAIAVIKSGRRLSRRQASDVFALIMTGQCPPEPMAELLAALAARGETADEIAGAADVMNRHVMRIRCDVDCIDTCGTGGDGISTLNVSTAAALVAASAGATVAKHGNRTNTRASGSAEAISQLGVNIDAPVPVLERCLRECRIAFLYAPNLHPAMRHAAPVRKQLGIRTIFNLLGPLTNPAGARRQLLGVPQPELTEVMARVLAARDAVHAWVVNAHCGLCDLTITGTTRVTEVRGGQIRTFTIDPEELGLPIAPLRSLLVDSPAHSAAVIQDVLAGRDVGPRHDHVLLNAGAALVVAGLAENLAHGIALAREAVASGRAAATLQHLCGVSHSQ